ncbi:MAG: PP2C family protein-serine/threonine phosphatase [Nocardioides sp.]
MSAPRADSARARPSGLRRRWLSWTRELDESEGSAMLGLLTLSLLATIAVANWPMVLPISLILLPLTLGSLILGPRQMPWFVVISLAFTAGSVPWQPELTSRFIVGIGLVFVVGFIFLLASFRRSSLGVAGPRGESMFVDLRDRIMRVSILPALPRDWFTEVVLRSAGGTPFAGDFVVAARPGDGDRLEICVVDVSGKGAQAGVRALQLSGAFGGLLGAVPADDFLRVANDYLVRQDWDEGFATAVHLSVNLRTGAVQVRCAGHPPAVQLNAGSGRWSAVPAEGPALGLIPDVDYPAVQRLLRRGDAIMLYTDGLVETPTRDIALGIDRLLGQAERELRGGFDTCGIQRLIETLGSRHDDRALLVVHRR